VQLGQATLIGLQRGLPLIEAGLATLERLHLAVQALGPIEEEAFLALEVGALLAGLLFGGALDLQRIVLPLQDELLLLGARLGGEPLCVALRVLDRATRR
jgi:hypothetical protein